MLYIAFTLCDLDNKTKAMSCSKKIDNKAKAMSKAMSIYTKQFIDNNAIVIENLIDTIDLIAESKCPGCEKCSVEPNPYDKNCYCTIDIKEKFKLFYPEAFVKIIFSLDDENSYGAYIDYLCLKKELYEDLNFYQSLEKISKIMEMPIKEYLNIE